MENSSIFDFKDFKEYLSIRFSTVGNSRGMRNKFATLIHASPSYVSKVLSGKIKLALENVPIINNLLQHNDQESEYFMLLVLFTQAGSKELEVFFKQKINDFHEKRRSEALWVQNAHDLPDHVQAKFFSQWFYVVIHVMTLIPTLQTKAVIAKRLKISLQMVTTALEYLVQMGLVEMVGDRFRNTKKRIHLKKDSNWILPYHQSLRQYTIQRLPESSPLDVHYSLVAALSLSDVEVVRKRIQKFIHEFEPLMAAASNEEVFVFGMDFLKV